MTEIKTETEINEYEILRTTPRLGAKGETIKLHPKQAKYLLLDKKIKPVAPDNPTPKPKE